MKVKPCNCGHDPELKVTTYGLESEETSTYRYVCPHCGTGVGGYDSKQEALENWNKYHALQSK